MWELLTLGNLATLLMLLLLQAVLGIDNLLYISMESKRVAPERQRYVRRLGVGLAIALRIVLLVVLTSAIQYLQDPFWTVHAGSLVDMKLSGHALIVLGGGGFIIYTAVKEIFHMLGVHDLVHEGAAKHRSTGAAVFWIAIMNVVFSFDSLLSALALTKVFAVMALAVVLSGVLMIWLSDHVTAFLQKNRMYEVLGLFILLIVGVMLLSEGGHIAHLSFFGHPIEPMAKSTFYFVIAVLIVIDVVQGRYQRKLTRTMQAAPALEPAA